MKQIITIALLVLLPLSATAGDLEDWLIEAAKDGNLSGVNQMLERGTYVDAVDKKGYTALRIAAQQVYQRMARALIKAGADVNARDKRGDTALMLAAGPGYTDIVWALIAAGANVNTQSKNGYTALILASWNGYTDIVKALIDRGWT